MGIAVLKDGFATAGAVTLDIINVMLANGFKAIFPINSTGGGEFQPPTGVALEKFVVTLEAGPDVDPLNATALTPKQPWRINFNVYNNATLGIIVGSDKVLGSDGGVPYTSASVKESTDTKTQIVGARGVVGADYSPMKVGAPVPVPLYFQTPAAHMPHWNNPTEGFINRRNKVWIGVTTGSTSSSSAEVPPAYPSDATKDVSKTYPLSYYLAITPRGVFLSIWQGSAANMSGTEYSWMLVQRPVKRDTGVVVTEGKAPVFCVNSVGGVINRFIVREADVTDATDSILATKDTKDGTAIINDKKQVGVSENNQYIVNYPSRLNTPRFAYTYELDMIGYASATVISATTEIPQTIYGESAERKYVGLHANQPLNNGMRLVALKSGGGIPVPV